MLINLIINNKKEDSNKKQTWSPDQSVNASSSKCLFIADLNLNLNVSSSCCELLCHILSKLCCLAASANCVISVFLSTQRTVRDIQRWNGV